MPNNICPRVARGHGTRDFYPASPHSTCRFIWRVLTRQTPRPPSRCGGASPRLRLRWWRSLGGDSETGGRYLCPQKTPLMRFGHELKGVRLADFLRAVEQQACSPRQLCALAGGPPHVAIASDPEACVRQLDRLRRWLEPQAAEKLPLRARQMGCCGTLYFSTSNLRTPEPRLYPFTECTVFTRQSAHPFTECTVSTRQSAHTRL